MLTILCIAGVGFAGLGLRVFMRSRTAWSRAEQLHERVRVLLCNNTDDELAELASDKPLILLEANARQARYGVTVKGRARRLTAGATVKRLASGDFAVALTMQVTNLASA